MADEEIKTPKKKLRTPEEASIDPAAQQMLKLADELGLSTAFSRADLMSACPIGSAGLCCDLCGMGPCRMTKDGMTGVCGATVDTIQARNFIRAVAAGSAALDAYWLPFSGNRQFKQAPRIIVALGRPSANTLLGNDAPISALRGKFHDRRGVKVMPTFHPAYLLREPDRKRDTWSDLKLVIAELSRLGIASPNPARG